MNKTREFLQLLLSLMVLFHLTISVDFSLSQDPTNQVPNTEWLTSFDSAETPIFIYDNSLAVTRPELPKVMYGAVFNRAAYLNSADRSTLTTFNQTNLQLLDFKALLHQALLNNIHLSRRYGS